MRTTVKTVSTALVIAVVAMILPAFAAADSPICHNGILSDDAGQSCADGLYEQVYGSGSGICHDGILSNDAGQGCADGLYSRGYGSGPSTASRTSASSGGSSNSMVNPSCESGGNPQIVSPNGTYWGKYQFDYQTWVAHGGSPGSYGSASEGAQDAVAARVTYDAWPNC